MKIFIICSKKFYSQIPPIQETLEKLGHELTFPNTYPDTGVEDRYRLVSEAERAAWKATMLQKSLDSVNRNEAVLVLNFEKNGMVNYVGGATFLEMYDAYRLGKKIFLYNDVPVGILEDEINGFGPIVINGNLDRIR